MGDNPSIVFLQTENLKYIFTSVDISQKINKKCFFFEMIIFQFHKLFDGSERIFQELLYDIFRFEKFLYQGVANCQIP